MRRLNIKKTSAKFCWQLYQEAQDPAGANPAIELEEAERMSPTSPPSSNDSTGGVQHQNQAKAEGLEAFSSNSEQEKNISASAISTYI